ncbi:MAG: GntR family transcriptional regulator [Castellaniella sp.]
MQSQSVVDIIGHQLREDIISGRLLPGTQLVETDLAQNYRASRNSIREVLHLLVRDGLASSERFRGVFVRVFHENDLDDIYKARRTIQLSALHSTVDWPPVLLDEIEGIIIRARQAIASERWQDVGTLSLAFHQALVSVLGSRLINEFFLNISAQLRLIFTIVPDERIVQEPRWVEWEASILDHLRNAAHDAAEAELAAYLDESQEALTRIVRTARQRPPHGTRTHPFQAR